MYVCMYVCMHACMHACIYTLHIAYIRSIMIIGYSCSQEILPTLIRLGAQGIGHLCLGYA